MLASSVSCPMTWPATCSACRFVLRQVDLLAPLVDAELGLGLVGMDVLPDVDSMGAMLLSRVEGVQLVVEASDDVFAELRVVESVLDSKESHHDVPHDLVLDVLIILRRDYADACPWFLFLASIFLIGFFFVIALCQVG